ncbi:UNVERIFIED_ORG: pimeloyl-ACP methyl ester carboxylesterase [Methylorubrum zatmanii]|nr:pimeloyl-ACP methyl ester carboxylesterase [Methylorubrum zatmanii]
MSPESKSTRLAANGITLAYDSFGDEAAETILLIAGLGTQMIRWTSPFCRELETRGYRVVRFDNRDTGCSTHFTQQGAMDFAALAAALAEGRRPELAYTLNDMVSDALGLLDALSIRRAHIVGRSMGGMIAQIMASEHPSRVLSLTSIMSATGNPGMPSAKPDAMTLMMRPAPDPRLGQGGLPRSRRGLRTVYCGHCSSVQRRGLPRSPLGGSSARPCAGRVRTPTRSGWDGW